MKYFTLLLAVKIVIKGTKSSDVSIEKISDSFVASNTKFFLEIPRFEKKIKYFAEI